MIRIFLDAFAAVVMTGFATKTETAKVLEALKEERTRCGLTHWCPSLNWMRQRRATRTT